MNLTDQFTEKTVEPSFSSGGFAVTPIMREPEQPAPT